MTRHPSLLISAAGIEFARKRVAEEQWAADILRRLVSESGVLQAESLPVFEKDWWKEASRKHWKDTYPEANRHTLFAVVEPVNRALSAAMAYAVTGDACYAEAVIRVLLHYTNYEFFVVHPDVGLNWSSWCIQLMAAYDVVYDTIGESNRHGIDDFFRRAMKAIRANDEWWVRDNMGGHFNNHYAWHKLFIGSYGVFYDQLELVDYAINSEQGVRALIENGSRDDGLWFEGSLNYQFTAAIGLAMLAEVLANSSYPLELWTHEFANGRSLAALFTGPIATLFPDETLPTIGDTYAHRAKLSGQETYYAAYNALRLPEFAWVLREVNDIPTRALFFEHLPSDAGVAPAAETRVWPEHGYVALRSQEGADYWNGERYSAFLSFDRDGTHSHSDKFSLMAYARGRHIAVDPEAAASAAHAFSSTIQNELNRCTLCHNTVMVDGRDHAWIGSNLELLDFVNGPDIKLATIADRAEVVYLGVKMMRTVAVTEQFLLDVFQVASDVEHTYDYLFHTYSDSGDFEPQDGFRDLGFPERPPWSWLRQAKSKLVDTEWSVAACQAGVITRMSGVGEPGSKLITCRFPSSDTFADPAVPMLMLRRRATSTRFVTVLQAERGEMGPIDVKVSEQGQSRLGISVVCGGIRREFSVGRL